MKKILIVLAIMLLSSAGVQAYSVTVTDPAGDQIGVSGFDTTSIVYTVNENPLVVTITTNYTAAGLPVGDWHTLPADLILQGAKSSPPDLAIPLVTHGNFIAGQLYKVTDWYTSDEIAALNNVTNPPYSWGFGQNVWIQEGEAYNGYTGSVLWGAPGVTYTASNWYWTDADPAGDYLAISWATSTCANDFVGESVPEPATMLLLGCGLVGLAGFGRRKLFKK